MTQPSSQAGLTLIEVSISLVIVAILFASVVYGIGAITGAQAKSAAGELGGTIRSLYDTAALSGKTCRLVFKLPVTDKDSSAVEYSAECAAGNIAATTQASAAANEHDSSLSVEAAKEKHRVEDTVKFGAFRSEEIKPRKLPPAVKLSVWTPNQHTPVIHGTAYLYFFPQGFTERAQLWIKQGSNVWTLTVAPLTGKTTVVGEDLEVPRL